MVSLGGMGLYFAMLVRGSAAPVSANFYLVPSTAALLAWLLLGEGLSLPLAVVGLLVASGGCWLVSLPGGANRSCPPVSSIAAKRRILTCPVGPIAPRPTYYGKYTVLKLHPTDAGRAGCVLTAGADADTDNANTRPKITNRRTTASTDSVRRTMPQSPRSACPRSPASGKVDHRMQNSAGGYPHRQTLDRGTTAGGGKRFGLRNSQTSSSSARSSTFGGKPAPMPWMPCGPGLSPDSTALSCGSTPTIRRLGRLTFSPRAMPVSVPPVPTPTDDEIDRASRCPPRFLGGCRLMRRRIGRIVELPSDPGVAGAGDVWHPRGRSHRAFPALRVSIPPRRPASEAVSAVRSMRLPA